MTVSVSVYQMYILLSNSQTSADSIDPDQMASPSGLAGWHGTSVVGLSNFADWSEFWLKTCQMVHYSIKILYSCE